MLTEHLNNEIFGYLLLGVLMAALLYAAYTSIIGACKSWLLIYRGELLRLQIVLSNKLDQISNHTDLGGDKNPEQFNKAIERAMSNFPVQVAKSVVYVFSTIIVFGLIVRFL